MRATLSLDDHGAKLLRRELRCSGASLKAAVNHFLRLGLMVSGSHAQLVGLAIEYGGILQTTDRDCARFPGLPYSNPLE